MQTGSISLVVCVLSALVGGYLSQGNGGSMADGVWTLLATVPGVLIPTMILAMMPPKPAPMWSVPMLGGTMIRALIVLTIGLAVYMLAGPSKVIFFMTMLVALMITLILDVASVLSLIQKHTPSVSPAADAEGIS